MVKRYIAIISKSDETGGGASRIAAGLSRLLNDSEEFEAHHWVGLPGPNANWHTHKLHGGRWLSLVQGAFSVVSRAVGFPDFFTPELLIHLARKKVEYSLYHFHDISFTFSPLSMKWLAKRKPVLWTMHDCSPFTGGCIAPLGCEAFHTACKSCPQLSKLPLGTRLDFTGAMQAYKARMLRERHIKLVSPSRWLLEEANTSVRFDIQARHIPNYVDTDVFRPIRKDLARQVLGLPQDQFIVLLSATCIADTHKGGDYALDVLDNMPNKPFVVAIGKTDKEVERRLSHIPHHATGYIYNDRLLAQYYASADVFLFPTLADSFGLVAIETMACGTPTIAFKTGGVPEIIEHDRNGWLVDVGDVQGLVQAIELVQKEPDRLQRWSNSGLTKALKEYSPEKFLKSHLELYSKVLGKVHRHIDILT